MIVLKKWVRYPFLHGGITRKEPHMGVKECTPEFEEVVRKRKKEDNELMG